MKKYFLPLIALACVAACKKSGGTGDTLKPIINVTSPFANQQFGAGQTVNIVAAIVDNDQLHEIALSVVNKTTSAEVVHFHDHVDAQSYNLEKSFTTGSSTTYTVKVEAQDHSGNRSETVFEVRSN